MFDLLYILELKEAIREGTPDNIDDSILKVRNYIFLLTNLLWWIETALMIFAICRIRRFTIQSRAPVKLNEKELKLHLGSFILFDLACLPIIYLQLFESKYVGELYFTLQIAEIIIVAIGTITMLVIFLHISEQALQLKMQD